MKASFIFTDHAVLQREKPIKIWGEAVGEVTASLDGHTAECEAEDGKFELTLPSMPAGGPYDLSLSDREDSVTFHDIMIGEVWIAGGQSNMEQPVFATKGGFDAALHGDNNMIRFFTVPRRTSPGELKYSWHFESVYSEDTPWQICEKDSILHFSAVGYYFAAELQKKLNVPIGIISCNLGGTRAEAWLDENKLKGTNIGDFWLDLAKDSIYFKDSEEYERRYDKYKEALNTACQSVDALSVAEKLGPYAFARDSVICWPEALDFGPHDYNWFGTLYHNMVERIAPIGVRGVIWYQGESNHRVAERYLDTFSLVLESWRELWKEELPFLTVQIAPFRNIYNDKWVELMEQQALAEKKFEKVRTVTSTDIGETDNIHPINKRPIGERLCYAAMTECYGKKEEYSGPIYSHCEIENDSVRVFFDHAENGLICDDEVSELFICGENADYKKAVGKIDGNTLIVSSPEIDKPAAVRMAYHCFPQINLKNTEGITAAPFRTDKKF